MAISEKGLTDSVSKISDAITEYIITPSTMFGISGFVFDGEGETVVTHTSSITDNVIEDNSVIHDHIATKPVKIKLVRYMGELSLKEDNVLQTLAGKIVPVLGPVVAFAPKMVSVTKNVTSVISGNTPMSLDTLSNADDIYALFKNLNPFASKKQQAYIYFKALAEKGIPVSIQTPFQYFQNMAIETITATETEDNEEVSNFTLDMKQLRYASVTTTGFDESSFQSRAKTQQAPIKDNGKTNGLQSTAKKWFS